MRQARDLLLVTCLTFVKVKVHLWGVRDGFKEWMDSLNFHDDVVMLVTCISDKYRSNFLVSHTVVPCLSLYPQWSHVWLHTEWGRG